MAGTELWARLIWKFEDWVCGFLEKISPIQNQGYTVLQGTQGLWKVLMLRGRGYEGVVQYLFTHYPLISAAIYWQFYNAQWGEHEQVGSNKITNILMHWRTVRSFAIGLLRVSDATFPGLCWKGTPFLRMLFGVLRLAVDWAGKRGQCSFDVYIYLYIYI
jgi:hypothetical protein